MCGRYQFEGIEEKIAAFCQVEPDEFKQGEVAPTDTALVLTKDGARAMRWGFAEDFSKAPIFNARQEKVMQSPLFSDSFAKRRVVVPTSGFYEWKSEADLDLLGMPMKPYKIKYLFRLPDEPVLFLAGFYKMCIVKGGEAQPCFTILTTEPNDSMRDVHDRMPVILKESELAAWLADDAFAAAIMPRMPPALARTHA